MARIRHTGIVTKNLQKSIKFWNKYLKFKIHKQTNESGELIDRIMLYKNVKVKTIKLKDSNGLLIELLSFRNPPKTREKKIKPYSNGITHISITVKNIKKLYNFLIKKKIKFNSAPKVSADGKVLMTYCRTPEGAFLELVQEL